MNNLDIWLPDIKISNHVDRSFNYELIENLVRVYSSKAANNDIEDNIFNIE